MARASRSSRHFTGLVGAVVAFLVLTGCAPGGSNGSRTSITGSAPSAEQATSATASARNYFGTDAQKLVAMVPGCAGATLINSAGVESVVPALKNDPAVLTAADSASECTLRGHGVVVFSFTSNNDEQVNVSALAHVDNYFARGVGWSATATSTAVPNAQRSVAQTAALFLDGQVITGNQP